jgi:large subunit ribosomal protein L17
MRHRKKINHLSRKSAHRKAMLANMAASLILHKRINTTLAKAKVLRTYIEPLITKSKEDTTHSRRIVFSFLQNKEAVAELFRDISVKVAERPGGYTRIIKTGARLGDSAEMCMMELVDFNENLLGTKEAAKDKTTRRRRGTKKSAALPVSEAAKEPTENMVEKPVIEMPDGENPESEEQASPEAIAEQETTMEKSSDDIEMKAASIEESETSKPDGTKDLPEEESPNEPAGKDGSK